MQRMEWGWAGLSLGIIKDGQLSEHNMKGIGQGKESVLLGSHGTPNGAVAGVGNLAATQGFK